MSIYHWNPYFMESAQKVFIFSYLVVILCNQAEQMLHKCEKWKILKLRAFVHDSVKLEKIKGLLCTLQSYKTNMID